MQYILVCKGIRTLRNMLVTVCAILTLTYVELIEVFSNGTIY